jgi:hypothetical protein
MDGRLPRLSRTDASMQAQVLRRTALLILLVAGCDSAPNRQPTQPVVGRGTPAVPKTVAPPDRGPPPASIEIDDHSGIVPPPRPDLPGQASPIPTADTNIVLTKGEAAVIGASTTHLATAVAAAPEKQDEDLAAMKRVYEQAAAAYSRVDAFEARLTRRETVNGKAGQQEIISYKFRQQPFSIRLKWLGTEGQGREVIYVQGKYDGKMQILPAKQDSLLPLGRMAFLPDDPMVRAKARHDIREAGFGESIRQLGNMLALIAKNPTERKRLRYLKTVLRSEYPKPMQAIEETIPPKTEALFPQGGTRFYFFDTGEDSPSKGLPVIVVAYDASTRKEVEYYCFDLFMYPIRLDDKDFDPDQVWKKR